MRNRVIKIACFLLPLIISCNKVADISDNEFVEDFPITLNVETAITRSSIPSGMQGNFKVYAVSDKNGSATIEMNAYKVTFNNGTWSYVSDTQPLTYWKNHAERYRFTAAAPFDAVTAINATSMTLALENNTTGSVMAAEPLKIEHDSPDFGKTVNLRFGYAHCRVCVAFTKESTEDVTITGIQLTPNAAIASKASLTYTYDWSTATPTATQQVSTTETSAEAFSFANVTIPANTSDAMTSATYYYCVPDAANPKGWQVSLTCNGEVKLASFQNSETWESGKNYTYVFSLNGNAPTLVKVISGNESFFDCEDIIPGGSFSNNDITE